VLAIANVIASHGEKLLFVLIRTRSMRQTRKTLDGHVNFAGINANISENIKLSPLSF
jgi:hypothetical protein